MIDKILSCFSGNSSETFIVYLEIERIGEGIGKAINLGE